MELLPPDEVAHDRSRDLPSEYAIAGLGDTVVLGARSRHAGASAPVIAIMDGDAKVEADAAKGFADGSKVRTANFAKSPYNSCDTALAIAFRVIPELKTKLSKPSLINF